MIQARFSHGMRHQPLWFMAFWAAFVVLPACTTAPTVPSQVSKAHGEYAKPCRVVYTHFQRRVDANGVRDAQTVPINQFPYLHVNRFLSAFDIPLSDHKLFSAWVDHLQLLALQAQAIEFSNLPQQSQQALTKFTHETLPQTGDMDFMDSLRWCSAHLVGEELADEKVRRYVKAAAIVPSDYRTWWRVAGLYVFTALPVVYGIDRWHRESAAKFRLPYDQLAVKGELIRYYPQASADTLSRKEIAVLIQRAEDNPLSIPSFSKSELESLFAAYAPVFEVDTRVREDDMGSPVYRQGQLRVDVSRVKVFTLLSYTFFNGTVLPQLNYVTWFPARPCTSAADLLCGDLDGITWRVTLARDGTPIHYDVIHNCGCYHTFFPTQALTVRKPPPTWEEWAFIPIKAPLITGSERILLRQEATTHYVVSLQVIKKGRPVQGKDNKVYELVPYRTLRSLPFGTGQRKSMFQPNGLVAGTQRKERYILWPMGIPSPGSMRQWGHHATAFVGRRYFDDPCLLGKYYTPAGKVVGLSTPTLPAGINTCAKREVDNPAWTAD
jgi:hypothetical protein